MGYGDDINGILDDLLTKVTNLDEFDETLLNYNAETFEKVKTTPDITICMLFVRREALRESAGARAEHRDLFIEFWMLNRESHQKAVEHAGLIIDEIDKDKVLSGKVMWSTLADVEYYISAKMGYNLNWSKVTYRFERRRNR